MHQHIPILNKNSTLLGTGNVRSSAGQQAGKLQAAMCVPSCCFVIAPFSYHTPHKNKQRAAQSGADALQQECAMLLPLLRLLLMHTGCCWRFDSCSKAFKQNQQKFGNETHFCVALSRVQTPLTIIQARWWLFMFDSMPAFFLSWSQ